MRLRRRLAACKWRIRAVIPGALTSEDIAMADAATPKTAGLKEQSAEIRRSAAAVEAKAEELNRSEARRTDLAGDRTLLAAERTYAAWVRTGLAALASGVGARTLMKGVLPIWVGKVTGSVLIVFAGFCLIAAVWRELQGTKRVDRGDMRPIPTALLMPMNGFLLLVAIAALIGIWTG
jgi:putative membrane protein